MKSFFTAPSSLRENYSTIKGNFVAIIQYPFNDVYFRISLSASYALVLMIQRTLSNSSIHFYYAEALISFTVYTLLCYFLTELIFRVIVHLDKICDWQERPYTRTFSQLFFGFVPPLLLDLGLAHLFHAFLPHYVGTRNGFAHPLIGLYVLLVNLYYTFLYLIQKTTNGGNKENSQRNVLVVHIGHKNIPLQQSDISHIYRTGELVQVVTFTKQKYSCNVPLDELEQLLDKRDFFRANRQTIVHYKSCKHYEAAGYGKLKLALDPESEQPVIISQKRVKSFREWISQ